MGKDQPPFASFIIPSINRPSLRRTLESIQAQTDDDWEAVVAFDRASSIPIPIKPRGGIFFTITSRTSSGSAGLIRNEAIQFSRGKWLCFVDDDDYVSPDYVVHLRQHTKDHPRSEVVVFRMKDPRFGVLPDPIVPELALSHVGVSYAVNRALMSGFVPEHQFIKEQVHRVQHEDWQLLSDLKDAGRNIFISPHVDYFVREAKP